MTHQSWPKISLVPSSTSISQDQFMFHSKQLVVVFVDIEPLASVPGDIVTLNQYLKK
jgi:hypothetical protein